MPVVYAGGTAQDGIYESSSSHGPLLDFSGGRRYDLVHHLGFEPKVVLIYWSFKDSGIGVTDQTDRSTMTLGSGNSALSQLANEKYIRVKNDSCAEFWIRVVAFGGGAQPDGDGGISDVANEARLPLVQMIPLESSR